MDKAYIDQMCNYIKEIFSYSTPIIWSWGAVIFHHTEYKEMAALRFEVNGFIHKGDVVVAYNGGSDVFEVYCLGENDIVVSSNDDVYLDQLVEVIDSMVEKSGTKEEYNAQIIDWGETV